MEKENKIFSEEEKKLEEEKQRKLFASFLSFPHYLAKEDMEDYYKWVVGGTALLSEKRLKEMRILGTLKKLGYSLDHIGTYLLKEYVFEICNELRRCNYKESKKILKDVSSERSSIRKSLACDYLEISDGIFLKTIKAAMKNRKPEDINKEFARRVYGPNGESDNIGINAYKIAQDFNLWEDELTSKVVGKFVATTFSDKDIVFVVYDNDIIECQTLDIKKIRYIDLKPRFELHSEVMHYTYDAPKKEGNDSELIKEFDIDNELMYYLQKKGMVKYSQDMAMLYGFDPSKAYDRNGGYPFKRAVKKGPILTNQKKGYFN